MEHWPVRGHSELAIFILPFAARRNVFRRVPMLNDLTARNTKNASLGVVWLDLIYRVRMIVIKQWEIIR